MKSKRVLPVLILLTISALPGMINSQWSADTLGMGKITANRLILFGNTLITGTQDSGIFIRANYEEKWKRIYNSPKEIRGLVISGNNLVAGTTNDGIFYSTNSGLNWKPSVINAKVIITVFDNKTNLLAGTKNGIFRSSDNGITWSETSMKNVTYSIAEIGMNYYAGTNKGLHIASSLTGQWTKIFDRTTNSIIAFNDTILIANNDGTIWRKKSNENWIEVYSLGRDIYKLFNISNIVFAGTYINGIICSTDYGINWQESCLGQDTYMKKALVWDILISGTKLYACTGGGIYKTDLRFCIEP